jgi:hypothetical protein
VTDHPEKHVDDDDDDDIGFVMVGETQIPIVDVHLCAGRITVMARAMSPFPGASGRVTVYGHDLQSIMAMPQTVTIPPLLKPGLAMMFSIPLGVDGIIMADNDDHPHA